MRDDELQILGTEKKKQNKLIASVIVLTAIIVGIGLYWVFVVKKPQEVVIGDSTIVPELQHAVDSLLHAELKLINGQQGQVIVMEVQTGEILAMVGRERRYDGQFQSCDNFAYQQEPGSTMITPALLALLETGNIKLSDKVETGSGLWNIDGELDMLDNNWRRGGNGEITLSQALEVSSNIGVSKTIQRIFKGKEQSYYEFLDRMCFGQPDSIEGIKGLKHMVFSSPKDSIWASRQMLWNSIGYERLMAPIQMLTFYNAIANNGKMVKPTLTKGNNEVINQQIASKNNICEIQHALFNVVNQGSGKQAGLTIVSVAGKTGTAQIVPKYEDENIKEYHLSFCGYFPAESPQYSIMVSINKLGLPASSGSMAGIVFRDIVEWMVTHKQSH